MELANPREAVDRDIAYARDQRSLGRNRPSTSRTVFQVLRASFLKFNRETPRLQSVTVTLIHSRILSSIALQIGKSSKGT